MGRSAVKKHIPYFSFYPADFMNGVRGMTPQDVGVYTMLLCRIYEENGPVEYHPLRLATYCGMRLAAFEAVMLRLSDLGKVVISDGMIRNLRAEAEIEKRLTGLASASRAGKASVEKKRGNASEIHIRADDCNFQQNVNLVNAGKDQRNQQGVATDVQQPFNHTDTDTDTIRDTALSRRKPAPERFQEFWDFYPHRAGVKRGRKPASEKYARIVRGGLSEQSLIDAARRYARDKQVIDGFAKDPMTWLNSAGWEDEVQARASPDVGRAAMMARFQKIAGAT